jgi:starch phosphorylase
MSSHRMLMEYSNKFYFPALKNHKRLEKDAFEESKGLAAYLNKVRSSWHELSVAKIESNAKPIMQRGDSVTVSACVKLGSLSPDEVLVELYYGSMSNQGEIVNAIRTEMKPIGGEADCFKYRVGITCESTGKQGHTVRILPKHPGLVHPYLPGLIKWA